ncbi:MAG: DUF1566 domain-containing protein, partial [Putridiphycobacter sp.]|nr:DUF1566 domain-containing protein [Putridiphycobacter sp.]
IVIKPRMTGNNYFAVGSKVYVFTNGKQQLKTVLSGQSFYGQDAHYTGNQPSYTDNGNGTISDNVTGLMWEQDMGVKLSYEDAFTKAANSTLGGYTDWRVPTIKELYSLAIFTGRCFGDEAIFKFIDTNYFNQPIGDESIGEREIDAQTWSSTQYVGLIMAGDTAVFGYNFVDGRLKGYPKYDPQTGAPNTMYFRMVRGNPSYGINNFVDNGDGTITDEATGLMWQQADDSNKRDWENALSYAENLTLAGYNDWRLPNAKELQSIVDYTRCPAVTNSPAIDPLFTCSVLINPAGNPNYGYYWTSSPLMDGPTPYSDAVYISFGEAQGQMALPPTMTPAIYDTHGAGAQRNDPKDFNTGTYPSYFGPQGDILYVKNYVRAVRTEDTTLSNLNHFEQIYLNAYPNPTGGMLTIQTVDIHSQINVTVRNVIGEAIASYIFEDENQFKVEINGPAGIYFINVKAANGATNTFKVIKE